jgi:hypothetical protein
MLALQVIVSMRHWLRRDIMSKALKEKVEEIARVFSFLYGVPSELSFSGFQLPVVIENIELAKVTGQVLVPDKRMGDNGRQYTPPMLQINCRDRTLLFALEDIKISLGLFGIDIEVEDFGVVTFEEVDPDARGE